MKARKMQPARSGFPIVGIGASAGGLAAFGELLSALPTDSGMGFVLIQHLDPTHASMLGEALARSTRMKVATAVDGIVVERNHVYVIPPNTDIALSGDALHLVSRDESRKPHLAIDFFLRSLAHERGAQAIGVVLSGSGSDGTEGLRAIRAEGGITFAQAPATAKFGEMPQSAISAGVVDTGMAVAALARELVRLSHHPYLAAAAEPNDLSESDRVTLESVLDLVRNKSGVDFSEYKRATIERRTIRRMVLREQSDLESYLQLLRTDENEASALCEDVLIHVTSFFRDPAAFQALAREILPQIFAAKAKGEPLRAWVAGCSTGEEVYSLAISLLESEAMEKQPRTMQVFGSDLSGAAVEKARAGIFSDAALREVSEEIRRKYFVKVDQGYRISKQVRELCIFVRHDLARDPPFARLDIVSCRNVLIYFGSTLQKRLMATFHYCLNRPGFLLLGRSESITGHAQYFTPIDRENKIYARTPSRSVLQFTPTAKGPLAPPSVASPLDASRPPFDLIKHVDRMMLSKYAPAGVVLNEKLEVLQFRGRTGPFLEAAAGQPQTNVLKMAREGLLVPLKSALAQAQKQKAAVRKHDVAVGERGNVTHCDVVVMPLLTWPGSTETLYAVLFEEIAPPLRVVRTAGRPTSEVTKLRRELQTSKEYQQSLLEEHSRVNDDLGTANEELVTGNEELQSMNEELQTAKEELQSANEQLTTVNDELHSGNRELNLANTDLVNLLNTVEIAIIFVDAQRKIRRFTPQAQSIFNVLLTDIGRPIDEIKPKVNVPDLDAQIAWAIANAAARESEVQDQFGRWFRMQIRPYQTSEGKADGALLSLVDIDLLKRHVDQAEWSRDYAVSIVDAVLVPLVVLDGRLHVISANEAFYAVFGGSHQEMEARSFFARGEWNIPALRARLGELFTGGAPFQILEVEGVFPQVGKRTMSFTARAVNFRNSRPMALLAIEDVSARKQAEVERLLLLRGAHQARETAEQANRTKDAFLATLSHELRTPIGTILMNAQLMRHPGLSPEKMQRISETIERSSKTQSRLIEDLLDVSRIVTGKLSLSLQRLNLLDVVPGVVEGLALQAEKKQIKLALRLDEETAPISGDSPRLQQVISNLLTNAIKFTPEGGAVTVTLNSEHGEVLLSVTDTGKGIPAEFLPFVFERFSQQENSSVRRHGGLGLGLSIVRDIVELHGGKVRAMSAGAGLGATFTVILPLLHAAVEGPRQAPAAPPDLSQMNGLRILVVDDDAEILEAVTEMLKLRGAQVVSARSAEEALRFAEAPGLQVIVCDLAMPGTDGHTLIRSIRALPSKEQSSVPAIALTAVAAAGGRKRAFEAGFQEYLEKPVDLEKLTFALLHLSQPRIRS